jgi:two-component system nitrate/nitrite sensor histidine kinase NarX
VADPYQRSQLASPLWVGDRVIGALCVGSQQSQAFSEDASARLAKLASAAAVALENARLYGEAERFAALEERQRIAAEMHDGLAQMMSYLGLMVDQAEDAVEDGSLEQAAEILERVRKGIDQAGIEVRRSITSLQEELPPSLSLQQQLAKLVQELSRLNPGDISLGTELEGALYLPLDQTQQVLGIAREALTNALRHSNAREIWLRLAVSGGEARLCIEDDGTGFDTHQPLADGRTHFGLNILRARAARLNGEIEIKSGPGIGTGVFLSWPVDKVLGEKELERA